MQASETKLQPIIEGAKQYVVPLFQRQYSWEKKEWEALLDDLVELSEEEHPRTHFMGSIVTMPTSSVPEGVSKFLLIDGQQRITTIFILLALLRDNAKKSGQTKLEEQINNTLLTNPYESDIDYYKLLPTQYDRIAFQALINSEQLFTNNQITKAYQFFQKEIQKRGIDGQALKKVIFSNLSVVSIVLSKDDDPYLVFESLNAKGRSLTQADLIRNYFFMKIHVNEQQSVYERYWKPMQDAFQGNNLSEFIRHYLMRDGTIVKQSDIYFFVKELINRGEVVECLKELACFAGYYEKLLHPEKETHIKIRKALQRLNRIEVTTAYPLLLNFYDEYYHNRISDVEFIILLKLIENFMIRRFVCNIATNQLNKVFPPLYGQIKNRYPSDIVEGLKQILQTKNYPKNTEFKTRLLDTKLYGGGDRSIKTKLILETLEEFYQHKELVDFDGLSIEHIMPQTLTESWQKQLGDDWDTTHELLLHTLGNLTLTAYNSELSNDSFEAKKMQLSESHLEMNKYFKDHDSWRREDIEKRSSFLADMALAIWPYFGDEKAEQLTYKRATSTSPKSLCILGQSITVRTWRDVLEQTMNTIADLEPDKFDQIVQDFPRSVGLDEKKFRDKRQLKNGMFIEVNLSAQDIQRFCFQALEVAGLTMDDWKVDLA
jgi:uncharacterized protein with ParB-like and HNH nuclease domain